MCFPRAKYIVLRSLSKSLLCEDVLESMVCLDVSAAIVRETVQCLFMSPFATLQIVFQEAWWIGTAEENPGELRLEMPHDLAAPGEVAVPAVDTLPEVQAPTPASVRATPKRRRDMEGASGDRGGVKHAVLQYVDSFHDVFGTCWLLCRRRQRLPPWRPKVRDGDVDVSAPNTACEF